VTHLDHYIDPNNRTEEQQYYFDNANPTAHLGSKRSLTQLAQGRWFGHLPTTEGEQLQTHAMAISLANSGDLNALHLQEILTKASPFNQDFYSDLAVTQMLLGNWIGALGALFKGLHSSKHCSTLPCKVSPTLVNNLLLFLNNTFMRHQASDPDIPRQRKLILDSVTQYPFPEGVASQMQAILASHGDI